MDASMKAQREHLLVTLKSQGILDPRVLAAIENVPRHRFVPEDLQHEAYGNYPLPIGRSQTISQPYIVAYMTQALVNCAPATHKVLEIGTGSGYQSAILAEVFDEVYSIERIESLHQQATALLKQLDYANIHTRYGDGHEGWPDAAPFDAIIVTAAAEKTPDILLEQLSDGGCMISPVAENGEQILKRYVRQGDSYSTELLEYVRFVPFRKGME